MRSPFRNKKFLYINFLSHFGIMGKYAAFTLTELSLASKFLLFILGCKSERRPLQTSGLEHPLQLCGEFLSE